MKIKSVYNEGFLKKHIQNIIDFYHPICIDNERGGYINQLNDNGEIYDRDTKHLVGTCRFIYNYAIAAITLNISEYIDCCVHGINFLKLQHHQSDGGYAWIINKNGVKDATRHCYGHAFVLLAASAAAKANIGGSLKLIYDTYELLESRFWDKKFKLYVDEIHEKDWKQISPYRGQNANMHICEALLSAYEVTGQKKFLNRACILAKRICIDLTSDTNGLIWEHYNSDWTNDWTYNKNDKKNIFRPYGYLSGHFTEWAKLLLILERYCHEKWMLDKAKNLFDTALEKCWDNEFDGMYYSFDNNGIIIDTDRYYWVLAETIVASALLACRTGQVKYWDWYDKLWEYSLKYFVDRKNGGWYRIINYKNKKYDDKKSPPAKTDYHPVGACFETIKAFKLNQ